MNGITARITQICGGDCLVSEDKRDLFYTVLGSCIAACIYDPVAGIGGMNHGPEGVRGYFTQNAGPSQVVFRDVRIKAIGEGFALVSMIGAIGRPGAGEPRDFRFLQTYRRDADGWRIVGHHGSHSL